MFFANTLIKFELEYLLPHGYKDECGKDLLHGSEK
jgi:hypothetical protein